MLMSWVPLIMVAVAPMVKTDTSFSVPTGSRLALHNFAGTVFVRPGARNIVRIQATHPRLVRVVVSQEGPSYEIRIRGRHAPQPPVDYQITAPAWMPLDLEGFHCDMDIAGWQSDVMAETVRGGLRLRGGQGLVRLSSMTGGVDVVGSQGRLQISSVQSGVGVHNSEGEISIEAVNGNVVLDRVRSRLIEAATVNGDVQFTGWIDDAGRYRLATHRGNLDVMLPPETDATVLVSTFSGGFQSAFPVQPGAMRPGRNFSFRLRDGRAMVDLQSFEGRINLRQGQPPMPPPGAAPPIPPPPGER
jgi:hypothetical protein